MSESGISTDNTPFHSRLVAFTSRTIIVIQIVTVGTAFLIALLVKPFIVTEEHVYIAAFLGQIFLQLMPGVMIFVIIMNVVTAIAHTESINPPLIVVKSIVCFIFTSLLSVAVGIVFALTIPPDTTFDASAGKAFVYDPVDTLYSLFMNICQRRLSGLFVGQEKYEVIIGETETVINGVLMNSTYSSLTVDTRDAINYLGIIAFFLIFGVALRKDHPKGHPEPPAKHFPILHTFTQITESIINCIHYILPVGLVSLMVNMLVHTQDWSLLLYMGRFIGVVLGGLLVHIVIILPLLCVLLAGKSPKPLMERFYSDVLHSTLLCTPRARTLELCQKKCKEAGISEQIWRLILPMGFQLSLNGTALYEGAAAVFIARLQNVSLDFWQLVVLGLTVAMTSIGVCEIRSRGAVITLFVLKSMGLQYYYYTALLAVIEIILYPLYDAVNVLGNCLGAIVMYQRSRSLLGPQIGNPNARVATED